MRKTMAVHLLLAAAGTLLIAGVILGVTKQWMAAALLGAGAPCCAAAALNFRNRKDGE